MISLSPATISFKKLLLNGTKLTSVDVIDKRVSDGVEYYKVHMENVIVESVQESASSEGPVLSVSLAPDRIAWQQIKTAGSTQKHLTAGILSQIRNGSMLFDNLFIRNKK